MSACTVYECFIIYWQGTYGPRGDGIPNSDAIATAADFLFTLFDETKYILYSSVISHWLIKTVYCYIDWGGDCQTHHIYTICRHCLTCIFTSVELWVMVCPYYKSSFPPLCRSLSAISFERSALLGVMRGYFTCLHQFNIAGALIREAVVAHALCNCRVGGSIGGSNPASSCLHAKVSLNPGCYQ